MVIGPMTGASLNPARAFGPELVSAFGGGVDPLGQLIPVYVLPGLVGAGARGVRLRLPGRAAQDRRAPIKDAVTTPDPGVAAAAQVREDPHGHRHADACASCSTTRSRSSRTRSPASPPRTATSCATTPRRRSSSAPTRRAQGKVALVSGGGSGHEPLHGGFVGLGMLDAACPGEVFTSPVPDQMLAATKAVDGGAGVVHLVKNYTGDVMNFKLAAEDAADEGIGVESRAARRRRRRAGLALHRGPPRRRRDRAGREDRRRGRRARRRPRRGGRLRPAGQRARALVRRRAVVVHPARLGPADLRPPRRGRWRSASASTASRAGGASRSAPRAQVADVMVEAVIDDLAPDPRRRSARVHNSMGGTPLLELYVLLRRDRARRCASAGWSRRAGWSGPTSRRWRWPARR